MSYNLRAAACALAGALVLGALCACSANTEPPANASSALSAAGEGSSASVAAEGFEAGLTAQLIKAEDEANAVYIDADVDADFSELESQGILVNRANVAITSNEDNFYMRFRYETDYGDLVIYADDEYAYTIDDFVQVIYRSKLGFSSSSMKSLLRNYEDTVAQVTDYKVSHTTVYDTEYYSEEFVLDGEKQVWCYDENSTLKYMIAYKDGQIDEILTLNTYEMKYNDTVFTLPNYHVADTGESIVL